MGLALAEVIGGFGKSLELRHKIRIGVLSPLLGLLISFDLTSFWMIAWQDRGAIPVNFLSLATGLVIFGIYYLIAQLAFPEDLEKWPDLDAYYFEHKKWLVSGMWICNVLAILGEAAIGMHPVSEPSDWVTIAAFTSGALGLILLPGKKTNVALLIYQCSLYILFDVAGVLSANWY